MNEIKRKDTLMIFTFASLALALVSSISYMIYTIASSGSIINHIISIISTVVLVVFAILLVVTGFFIENKKAKILITVASLLLACYSIIQIVIGVTSNKVTLPDFTNKDIKEVSKWAQDNNIELIKEYSFSETVPKFYIISQDVKAGTNIKKIKKLTVVISNGIDETKLTNVDDMTGWNLDDVIKFIDDNKLTNVTINFEFSNTVPKDTIISQDKISEITRNEPITLVSSLGRETDQKSVTVDNLIGLDSFHAIIYLKRNNIKYEIKYVFSSEKDDVVINQSIKYSSIIDRNRKQVMVLTIAKENQITVPEDLYSMSKDKIDEWANENHIIITYTEQADDTIEKDHLISINVVAGSTIEAGSKLNAVISTGQLKMIEFTSVSEFEDWANKNNVSFNIEYQFSSSVEKGNLISSSHKKNAIIKNDDVVKIVVSEGSNATVPNLVGLTKEQATTTCKNSNIKCNFKSEGNVVIKQSMKANSTVPANTSVDLTLGN